VVDQEIEIRFGRYRDKLKGLRKFKKQLGEAMEAVKKMEFGAVADGYGDYTKLIEKEQKIKNKL
jgi:hypothetical protein